MLEILDAKKNRLQDCPEAIGSLSLLKRLELDGNRLEVLPPSLSQLTQLEVLTLSSNHVYQLPDEIVGLAKLKVETLDVNGNMLTHLPPGFGALRLRSLKLSYNRLETLRHEVFRPKLNGTLRQLWLSNNNLLQLPDSFVELSKVQEVQMDSNPYKSPPPELLAEGITTVMQYVRVRMHRIDLLHKLILNRLSPQGGGQPRQQQRKYPISEMPCLVNYRGFDTCLEALVPQCCGVLMSNTGYLTPPDLDEFDKAINRFINGDFYRHPLTAETILDVVQDLRATRKKEFYERIVAHLMAQIFFEETRDVFSENVFCRHTTRPWGRRGGPVIGLWTFIQGDLGTVTLKVGCLAIALSALFEDTPKNAFVEEFRPAFWTEALKTLPRTVFEYSHKALRKALLTLRSAYGPIATFEDLTFEFCECIDPNTGEEIRHPKGECVVPGLVVVKIIYTAQEALRRKEEEKEVFEAFKKTDTQVRKWIKTKQGSTRVTDEVKKRKAVQSFRVGIIDASIAQLQGLVTLKQELLVFAQQRKTQFDNGEPFHFHSLANTEEATALVENAEKEVNDKRDEIEALELERTHLKVKLKERVPEIAAQLEDSLVDKYCYVEYTEILNRNRTRALKEGWRRPWDGMDGEDFGKWAKERNCVAADRRERPENVAEYRTMEVPADDRNWDEAPSDLSERLNWDGTDNMETFRIPTLVEWKEKRAARVVAGLDPNASASEEDEGEDEDTKSGDGDDKQHSGVRSNDNDADDDANRSGRVDARDKSDAADGDAGALGGGSTKADGDATTK
ncbi:unnamed protein product [Ectocarpus sp. CCAP 1310/34]|nr:unnamed protein product [Ectocarpus sp. CCAP 1310/34]